jgi:segregation and condensation protein B
MRFARIIEAILFAADAPQTVEQISLGLPDLPLEEIEGALSALREEYEREERGWRLEQIAGGWQILSHPDLYPHVERFLEGKRRARLSRAAMEALAVVAYRQPITRGELEDLRQVDCGGVLHTLLERELVTICGRSPAIGRPLLYRTTERFLEHFGLGSLADLPRLEEVETLWASDEIRSQLDQEVERRMGPIESPSGEAGTPDEGSNGDGNGDGNGSGYGGTILDRLETGVGASREE